MAVLSLHPHLVLSCKSNWSHLRSLCVLASRIAAARPITVTLLVSNVGDILDKVKGEVARALGEEDNASQSVVRFVELTANPSELDGHFHQVWRTLMTENPKPSAAILDGFQLSWLEIIRSEPSPPLVLQWMMAFSGGFLSMCGPALLGGKGDIFREWTDDEFKNPEKWKPTVDGNIVTVPGMPHLYDWELYPQDVGEKSSKIVKAMATMSRFIVKADGLLTACALEYDGPECLDSITSWICENNSRETFHLGPMISFIPGTCKLSPLSIEAELRAIPDGNGLKAVEFLDNAKATRGERSVIYISFGTEHWPSSTDLIDVLLSTLEECNIPFIFTHAYHTAKISDEVNDHFTSLGLGIFMSFGPQQTILAHKACGWFLTHGGANGSMEALCQGIPMVGWPFTIDQPHNIAHLARTLDVAFELKEVRSGRHHRFYRSVRDEQPGKGQDRFRTELLNILKMMSGDVGMRKRANAERLGKALGLAWSRDGGRATQELNRFLDWVVGEGRGRD